MRDVDEAFPPAKGCKVVNIKNRYAVKGTSSYFIYPLEQGPGVQRYTVEKGLNVIS